MGLREHRAVHGELPIFQRRNREREHPLIGELERAGLRGHGGGSFPTAVKLRAVAASGTAPVVVVNGCEGEPLSRKDHLLLELLPHLVLDGALLAARMLGSREIVVAVELEAVAAGRAAERAIRERPEFRRRGRFASVAGVPGGYLSGQETALLRALGGGPAKPSLTPPFPFERGLAGRPTLVSNVETLAHVALIARHGARWYRQLGTDRHPGSRLVTITGSVANPSVLELASGTPLARVVNAAGGATERLRAFLLGGYAGTWVGAGDTAIALDDGELREQGATLGAGIVFALPERACPVAEVAHVARWLADNSAGQCGPCVHGLGAIAGSLAELAGDGDRSGGYAHLKRWCGLVTRRGACAMPDGAARFVRSALEAFNADFDDHARHGHCDACLGPRQLPVGLAAMAVA
jgi:NADH:ubiquinone oxidoreductase subunit F (NADH-binding)